MCNTRGKLTGSTSIYWTFFHCHDLCIPNSPWFISLGNRLSNEDISEQCLLRLIFTTLPDGIIVGELQTIERGNRPFQACSTNKIELAFSLTGSATNDNDKMTIL